MNIRQINEKFINILHEDVKAIVPDDLNLGKVELEKHGSYKKRPRYGN